MKLLLLLISAGIGIHCLPFKRCGENEELKRYGDYCFPTCANPHPASFFFCLTQNIGTIYFWLLSFLVLLLFYP
ncbi:hypothetical protein Y032_0194g1450 [Ancylostoma ceylanicum]|uniref:Uncharacterized protein n=1 Tax=Ancylostoma ceylanicum TaxID=53326 RepID=A0A016SP13_9BILA|nr:hypothetical protein Y032_0194g1450 [Ancylostoma ceylanicum]